MGTRRLAILLLWAVLSPPVAATERVVEIEARGDAYPEGDPSSQGWLRLAARVSHRLAPRVLLTAAPVVEADSHGDVDRHRLYDDDDRDPRRALLRFERLSLRFDLGAVQLEIGKQPLTWGRTDAVNPTDNLTPRDWTDPLDEVRLSPWAVRLHVEKRRWEAELALVPRYAPSRLPRLGGRWAPIEPLRLADPLFSLSAPAELRIEPGFADPRYPDTSLDHLQTGLRLGRRASRGEWAVSWFRGFDDAPHFDLSVGEPDPAAGTLPLVFTPRFPRLEVIGADGVLLAGAWALRGEAGRFRFPDGLDESFLLYEVDVEWTRAAWRLVAAYADFSGGGPSRPLGGPLAGLGSVRGPVGPGALDLGFLPAVFLHLGRSLPTEWEASLEAIVGTEDGDRLVRLSGSWPVRDSLRLGAEIDHLAGRSGSFFGTWRDNDRLRLHLEAAF